MSEKPTFLQLCLANAARPDSIDDFVGRWHDGLAGQPLSLQAFLGLDNEEYEIWMRDAHAIHGIVEARRQQRPLAEFTEDFYSAMR
ncbi:hypothetical protein ACLB1G_25405 [Oxalobacteraceae bacterium A2-2]